MKIIANANVIGFAITVLCKFIFVENTQVILRKNDEKSNRGHVTFTCDVDPPNWAKIYNVQFFYGSNEANKEISMMTGEGIHFSGNDITFNLASINGTNLDNEYYCKANLSTDHHYSMMSNAIKFEFKRYTTPNYTTEVPPVKKRAIITEGAQLLHRLYVGDYLVFSCFVEPNSTELYQYRWFRYGKDLTINRLEDVIIPQWYKSSRNGSQLVFMNVSREHYGVYICEATVEGGSPLQSNVLVISKIRSRPTTTTMPPTSLTATTEFDDSKVVIKKDMSVYLDDIRQYDSVNFYCEFSSTKANSIREVWYLNGNHLPISAAEEIYGFSELLRLEFIQPRATGKLTCEVETETGRIYRSEPLELYVKDVNYVSKNGPKVLAEMGGKPKQYSINITENENVYFTCTIEPYYYNSRNYSIEWFFNNHRLKSNDEVYILQNNSTLVLPRITHRYSGIYSCHVETDTSVVRSNNLRISILDDPTHGTNPKNLPLLVTEILHFDSIVEGKKVTFKCRIYPNNRTNIRNIAWFRDGHQIYPDDVKTESYSVTFRIVAVRKRDIGNYTCKADTDTGTLTSIPVSLSSVQDAHEDPGIKNSGITPKVRARLGNPLHIKAQVGDTVFFICDVEPDTTNIRKLSWFFKDQPIEESNKVHYLYGNYTMVLVNITQASIGLYHCKVDTKTGKNSVSSDHVTMGVQRRKNPMNDTDQYFLILELEQHPDRIFEGDDISIYCNIFPRPDWRTEIEWFFNGRKIPYEYFHGVIKGQTLKIYEIRKSDVGDYICKFTTKENRDYSSLPLPQFKLKDKKSKFTYPFHETDSESKTKIHR